MSDFSFLQKYIPYRKRKGLRFHLFWSMKPLKVINLVHLNTYTYNCVNNATTHFSVCISKTVYKLEAEVFVIVDKIDTSITEILREKSL